MRRRMPASPLVAAGPETTTRGADREPRDSSPLLAMRPVREIPSCAWDAKLAAPPTRTRLAATLPCCGEARAVGIRTGAPFPRPTQTTRRLIASGRWIALET